MVVVVDEIVVDHLNPKLAGLPVILLFNFRKIWVISKSRDVSCLSVILIYSLLLVLWVLKNLLVGDLGILAVFSKGTCLFCEDEAKEVL